MAASGLPSGGDQGSLLPSQGSVSRFPFLPPEKRHSSFSGDWPSHWRRRAKAGQDPCPLPAQKSGSDHGAAKSHRVWRFPRRSSEDQG